MGSHESLRAKCNKQRNDIYKVVAIHVKGEWVKISGGHSPNLRCCELKIQVLRTEILGVAKSIIQHKKALKSHFQTSTCCGRNSSQHPRSAPVQDDIGFLLTDIRRIYEHFIILWLLRDIRSVVFLWNLLMVIPLGTPSKRHNNFPLEDNFSAFPMGVDCTILLGRTLKFDIEGTVLKSFAIFGRICWNKWIKDTAF